MKNFLVLALASIGAAAPTLVTRGASRAATVTKGIECGAMPTHLLAAAVTDADFETAEAESPLDSDLEEFETASIFSQAAHEEDTPYPYELVVQDYNTTAIHQPIATHRRETYDASECATHCNEHRACDAFAIYVEREPSCTDCSDPLALASTKCALFNTILKQSDVRKEIEKEDIQGETFTHAIRAYNGYNRIVSVATVTATVTTTARPAAFTIYHS